MKTRFFGLMGMWVVLALVLGSPAHAGTFSSRADFENANIWSWLGEGSGMSFSVWRNRTAYTERHGGRPTTTEYEVAGWCFIILTCPVDGGICTNDLVICGDELTDDAFSITNDGVAFNAGGFHFTCPVARRANSSSNKKHVAFDGSIEENHSKTRSTESLEGALSGSQGFFEGYCSSNEGFSKVKTVD